MGVTSFIVRSLNNSLYISSVHTSLPALNVYILETLHHRRWHNRIIIPKCSIFYFQCWWPPSSTILPGGLRIKVGPKTRGGPRSLVHHKAATHTHIHPLAKVWPLFYGHVTSRTSRVVCWFAARLGYTMMTTRGRKRMALCAMKHSAQFIRTQGMTHCGKFGSFHLPPPCPFLLKTLTRNGKRWGLVENEHFMTIITVRFYGL